MCQVWRDDEPADEQRLSDHKARTRPVMSAISDSAVVASDDGYYHVLNTDGTESVCGMIEKQQVAGDRGGERISRAEAEQRGFQPCDRCLMYPGDK